MLNPIKKQCYIIFILYVFGKGIEILKRQSGVFILFLIKIKEAYTNRKISSSA